MPARFPRRVSRASASCETFVKTRALPAVLPPRRERRFVVLLSGYDFVIMRSAKEDPVNDELPGTNTAKDPDEWTTGDEPMTGAQASYLKTLSTEAGEEFDETLTKADASKRIDELQEKTGRGR